MKSKFNSYVAVGAGFIVASIVAALTDHVTLMATWLPIGAAFIAISQSKKNKK